MPTDITTGTYTQVYARSLAEPESFWAEQAARIPWVEGPEKILDKIKTVYGAGFQMVC